VRKAFIVLNHTLIEDQKTELQHFFSVDSFIEMPEEVKSIWSGLRPEVDIYSSGINDVISWLERYGKEDDIVIVQGEFGATFYVVNFCFHKGMVPVYASSERRYMEKKYPDGRVDRHHIFKHVKFKLYERFPDGKGGMDE
jgi:hypothetical protein